VPIVILTLGDTRLQRFCFSQRFQHLAGLWLWQPSCILVVRPRSSMFKISIVDTPAQRRLAVEGKLSDLWVTASYHLQKCNA
jgi:hypothetical protein